MRALLFLFLSLFSTLLVADGLSAPAGDSKAGDVLTTQAVMNLLLGLALVIVVILALAWVLKRVNGFHIKHQKMKVVSSVPLGTRERAVLLEVGEKQLLLGVAPGQVTLLESFPDKIIDSNIGAKSEFHLKLKKEMNSRTEKKEAEE